LALVGPPHEGEEAGQAGAGQRAQRGVPRRQQLLAQRRKPLLRLVHRAVVLQLAQQHGEAAGHVGQLAGVQQRGGACGGKQAGGQGEGGVGGRRSMCGREPGARALLLCVNTISKKGVPA
jgi:hypothetical protein